MQMLSGAAYPHARETCGRWPGPWARTPRRAGALICLFLPLAGQEGRGCRKGWSTSTLATGHGRNFRRPPGPPPRRLSGSSAGQEPGLESTSGSDPHGQAESGGRGKSIGWESVSGSPLSGLRQDPSVVWVSVSSSAQWGTGQPAGLEELEAQDQDGSPSSIHTLAQPHAKCHLNELRLSGPHFTREETEAQMCMATGLRRSRGSLKSRSLSSSGF